MIDLSLKHVANPRLLPMTGGGDKVEEGVDTVVAETGVTLNPGLLRQNIIVLSFQISENLLEAVVLSGQEQVASDEMGQERKAGSC